MAHRIAEEPHIVPLHETRGYEVAKGEPDIRKWTVLSADGASVGEVDDVLVDTEALRVTYVDIALDKSYRQRGERERHVIVPIEAVDLDRTARIVRLESLSRGQIAELPIFGHERITPDFEEELRLHFDADAARRRESLREAKRELVESRFEEAVRERPRPPAAASAHVAKVVETEHVRRTVPVTHEELVIEHHPVVPGQPPATPGRDEIRIPLMKEEVVIEKRRVPKEEVVIRKQTVQREEVVEADVESEAVEVRGERGVRVRDDKQR